MARLRLLNDKSSTVYGMSEVKRVVLLLPGCTGEWNVSSWFAWVILLNMSGFGGWLARRLQLILSIVITGNLSSFSKNGNYGPFHKIRTRKTNQPQVPVRNV